MDRYKMSLTKYEKGAIAWLKKAQDVRPDGGVSKYYKLSSGWSNESYKEVSGYIIPTLIEVYKRTKNKEYLRRAIKIADWEIKVQDQEGKWEYVFDTGQVLIGLTAIYYETLDKRYLRSIIKAADWLLSVQSANGNWSTGEFALGFKNKVYKALGIFGNAHNTRTAWALLEVWKITHDLKYKVAAIKNLDWVVSNQLDNGYYLNCHTYSHYLVYAASGLLESGIILNNLKYIESAKRFADACTRLLGDSKYFEGNYNTRWKPAKSSHSCLTADAQLAIVFYRLFGLTGLDKYKKPAKKLLDFLKTNQDLTSKNSGIFGGVAGSYPLDGFYCPNTILSWATKFYLDALLIEASKKYDIKS